MTTTSLADVVITLWGLAEHFIAAGDIFNAITCLESLCQTNGLKMPPLSEAKTRLRLAELLLKYTENLSVAKDHLLRALLAIQAVHHHLFSPYLCFLRHIQLPTSDLLRFRIYYLLIHVLRRTGSHKQIKQQLKVAIDLAHRGGQCEWNVYFCMQLAAVHSAQRNYAAAKQCLVSAAECVSTDNDTQLRRLLAIAQAQLDINLGDASKAVTQLIALNSVPVPSSPLTVEQCHPIFLEIHRLLLISVGYLQLCNIHSSQQAVDELIRFSTAAQPHLLYHLTPPEESSQPLSMTPDREHLLLMWHSPRYLGAVVNVVSSVAKRSNDPLKASSFADSAWTLLQPLMQSEGLEAVDGRMAIMRDRMWLVHLLVNLRALQLEAAALASLASLNITAAYKAAVAGAEVYLAFPHHLRAFRSVLHFVMSQCLGALSMLEAPSADYTPAAIAHLEAACRHAMKDEQRVLYSLHLAGFLVRSGSIDRAMGLLEEVRPTAMQLPSLQALHHLVSSKIAALRGDFHKAEQLLETCLRIAKHPLANQQLVCYSRIFSAELALAVQGDRSQAISVAAGFLEQSKKDCLSPTAIGHSTQVSPVAKPYAAPDLVALIYTLELSSIVLPRLHAQLTDEARVLATAGRMEDAALKEQYAAQTAKAVEENARFLERTKASLQKKLISANDVVRLTSLLLDEPDYVGTNGTDSAPQPSLVQIADTMPMSSDARSTENGTSSVRPMDLCCSTKVSQDNNRQP